MNNIDNLQKVFKTENDFDLPKSNNNKFSTPFNKHNLCHKYI